MIVKYAALIVIGILFSCTSKNTGDTHQEADSAASKSVLSDTTFTLQKKTYHIQTLVGNTFCMLGTKGDTLIKEDGVFSYCFDNVDDDSLLDLRLLYSTNVPDIEDVFLMNRETFDFRKVDNFSNFPAWKHLKNTRYYYSYHRSGCADMNWGSELFYIKDFVTHSVGEIHGYECGYTDPGDGIYIYTVKHDTITHLIKTLPINTISTYKDYKWGFIEDYWTKNHKRFTDPDVK